MPEPEQKSEFDVSALFAALDAQREERGLSWSGVAREIWELSAELNARRRDHPISPATLTGMAERGGVSCQHALFKLLAGPESGELPSRRDHRSPRRTAGRRPRSTPALESARDTSTAVAGALRGDGRAAPEGRADLA